jgi:hypothetical protein
MFLMLFIHMLGHNMHAAGSTGGPAGRPAITQPAPNVHHHMHAYDTGGGPVG